MCVRAHGVHLLALDLGMHEGILGLDKVLDAGHEICEGKTRDTVAGVNKEFRETKPNVIQVGGFPEI